jgi:hypothetical protein
LETGVSDRQQNMIIFAIATLNLLIDCIEES